MKLYERPARSVQTTLADGVQAPRINAAVVKASCVVGTDDTRGRGNRPHTIKQQQYVQLNELPTRSVHTTPADVGTDPTHSSSSSM